MKGLLFACLLGAVLQSTIAMRGVVSLDTLTFDKVIGSQPYVLVKFDKMYSYGEQEDALKEFALRAANQTDLLVASVGVLEYGEKENQELAARFGVSTSDWPAFKLFSKGRTSPVNFTGEVTADGLSRFIMSETNLWIGRPGCLESFDAFAQEFMKAEPTGRSDVVKRGEAVVATLETTADKNAATVYLKVMEKVLATGDEYITKETARVNKLLKGKLSDEKKTSMRLRLNVLASFTLPPPAETAKEEL